MPMDSLGLGLAVIEQPGMMNTPELPAQYAGLDLVSIHASWPDFSFVQSLGVHNEAHPGFTVAVSPG